ncbi:MAG: Clp protease N-terminal domain-containing protein [Candidatus Melainabacteria bacterium]|nr:Clp protease N-terminal domain-containing protein [Candidatus Melainabacteria bacterium]
MFERFTQGAIKSILLAQDECRRMGHHAVDSEHLFLGIIAEESGLAAHFLEARGLTLANARQLVEQVKRPDTNPLTIELPYTHAAAKAFEFARQEAQSLNHSYVGTEHILLGLILEKKESKDLSELWRVLKHQGLLDQVYDALILYVRTRSKTPTDIGLDFEPPPKPQTLPIVEIFKSLGLQMVDVSKEAASEIKKNGKKSHKNGDKPDSIFTTDARMILESAWDIAHDRGSTVISTEHLILALDKCANLSPAELAWLTISELDSRESFRLPQPEIIDFSHFSKKAQKVLDKANEEARRLGYEFIGTDHILLGILKEKTNIANKVMKNLGITLNKLRKELPDFGRTEIDSIADELIYTPRTKRVFSMAKEEAEQLKSELIEPEHLLLAIEKEGKASDAIFNSGLAWQVLKRLEVAENIRPEVLKLIKAPVQSKKR